MKKFDFVSLLAAFTFSAYCTNALLKLPVNSTASIAISRVDQPWPDTKSKAYRELAFVIEITKTPAGVWTNGNPPTVEVKLLETLVGEVEPGIHRYKWDDRLLMLCPVGAEAEIARWKKTKVQPPASGSRWIVLYLGGAPSTVIRVEDTPQNRVDIFKQVEQFRLRRQEAQTIAEIENETYKTKRNAWVSLVKLNDLEDWSTKADVVAIAEPSSQQTDQQTFVVSEYIKGKHCSSHPASQKFVTLSGLDSNPAYRDSLWTRSDQVLLFLSERPLEAMNFVYQPVGEGVVLASAERSLHIKNHLAKTKAEDTPRLLLCGNIVTQRSLATRLSEYSVLISGVTSFMPEKVGKMYAGVDWIIGVEPLASPPGSLRLLMQRQGMPETRKEMTFQATSGPVEQQAIEFISSAISSE